MSDFSLADRTALGDRLQALKPGIAEEVTRVFLEAHPDWVARYGDRARRFGIEDAQFHIDSCEAPSRQAASGPLKTTASGRRAC